MVQNLRAYSILHVATIKWIMCVQENIELTSILQRPRLSSTIISGDFSLATRIMQPEECKENSQGWQKAGILLRRGGIFHPMPPHGYGPEQEV